MNKKLIMIGAVLFLFAGCATFESREVKEQKYGKAAPVIEQSFASKFMTKGNTWKIYLKASDSDGDMKSIFSDLSEGRRGGGGFTSFTRIKPENTKELSGYIHWYPGPDIEYYSVVVMTVQIEDMAGHFSSPVSFPLKIQTSGKQETPPQGIFQEKDLGPIMITIKPMIGDGGL